MESKELKEIEIKKRTCYYFDVIPKIKDFDFDNILIEEKSYKTLFGSKPLRIRLDKVDGFIRVYDEIGYLALLSPENQDAIYNRIRYLIIQKSGITYVFFDNYAKIKINF